MGGRCNVLFETINLRLSAAKLPSKIGDKMMRCILAAVFVLLGFVGSAFAQSSPVVVSGGCGTASYSSNPPYFTIDSHGNLCINGAGGGGAGPYSFTPLTPMQSGLAITSATALTVPSGATYAVICAEGQNVRYSTDGTTTPTASVGMLLLQNQCVSFSGSLSLSKFRAIQAAATATLDVSYFK